MQVLRIIIIINQVLRIINYNYNYYKPSTKNKAVDIEPKVGSISFGMDIEPKVTCALFWDLDKF